MRAIATGIARKLARVWPHLNERSRRMVAATEALQLGYGGISRMSRLCGLSRVTITRGIRELEDKPLDAGRIRRPGAGRPSLVTRDPDLPRILESMVEPVTRGDPESPLRWTCKSTRALAKELTTRRHTVSHEKVAQLLRAMDYSLQGNRKTEEGKDHPDRDAQFQYINEQVRQALSRGRAVISVDTKKKELIGNFDNKGRQWRKTKSPRPVKGHDFPDPSVPRAYPYGIYDLGRNTGFVNVGTDHDRGSIRRGFDQRLVALRGPESVSEGDKAVDHRGRGWQQRIPVASMETGIAGLGGRHGVVNPGMSFSSRDEQVEQGGASVVLVHLLELAGGTLAGLRDHRALDRRHDHSQGFDGDLPTGPA